jgi:ribonucleoside-diphosphate reductase alpha chain
MDTYRELIYKTHYARWLEDKQRRENWDETVLRFKRYMKPRVPKSLHSEFFEACLGILNMDVMPSMRFLWTAGEALDVDNIAGYNCAYLVIDDFKKFAETLYILMNGTGVGFSVEDKFISKLPPIPQILPYSKPAVTVEFQDSKLGWAKGFYRFLLLTLEGHPVAWDLSKIRPKGAKLKTFGGRASGAEPLEELLIYTRELILAYQGKKLDDIACHDWLCQIAHCVVVGGVRRSATISLSNLGSTKMRHAKDGEFWNIHPYRALANNSAVYEIKPDVPDFLEEWTSLIRSGSGERGIINRQALIDSALHAGRMYRTDYGVNPCGEVILRPDEFCNLSEVILRAGDTVSVMVKKAEMAAVLGVLQTTFTDFNFIGKNWKHNCEEERLMGVSLTGLNDSNLNINSSSEFLVATLTKMKEAVRKTVERWSKALGINTPKAMTCVKPSGTVSQLVNSASGLHARWSRYYIRRVRISAEDPICALLMDSGVKSAPEIGQTEKEHTVRVFDFPQESPQRAVVKDNISVVSQLDYWMLLKTHWCDHNPSATIYVRPDEWLDASQWVYKNWDKIAGLAFLPYDGGSYKLAPYESISKGKYETLKQEFPEIDFNRLPEFEKEDATKGAQEYACLGSSCEI